MQKLNEQQQAIKALEDKIEKRAANLDEKIKSVDECVNFDKKLIKALTNAENEYDLTLLPMGEFHGEKIS
jgi:vacuolar-type H+-ATPase subunit I/STV1